MATTNLDGLVGKVQCLSDLELATLLCLVAKEHCLIETEEDLVDDVAQELALIASDVFNLSYAILSLDDYESSESFGNAILNQRSSPLDSLNDSAKSSSHVVWRSCTAALVLCIVLPVPPPDLYSDLLKYPDSHPRFDGVVQAEPATESLDVNLDTRKLVNLVIAKDFNFAPEGIQIQGLELIRRKRIFSRTTIHTAPEAFLFLPLISRSEQATRLNKHLVDRIFISHYHHPEDGFPNLEEIDAEAQSDNQSSSSSIVRNTVLLKSAGQGGSSRFETEVKTLFSANGTKLTSRQMIDKLRHLSQSTTVSAEIRRYLQDIVVFLRLERGVAGGVSPHASSHFELLTKCLAPLHGLDYVTPSLVALAAKKIYPHRLLLCAPEKERSMQYGSELEAVQDAMEGLTPDDVIEAVLNSIECPL